MLKKNSNVIKYSNDVTYVSEMTQIYSMLNIQKYKFHNGQLIQIQNTFEQTDAKLHTTLKMTYPHK